MHEHEHSSPGPDACTLELPHRREAGHAAPLFDVPLPVRLCLRPSLSARGQLYPLALAPRPAPTQNGPRQPRCACRVNWALRRTERLKVHASMKVLSSCGI